MFRLIFFYYFHPREIPMTLNKFFNFPVLFSLLLGFVLLSVTPNLKAQDVDPKKQAVVVTADQPNIWTLEQAHYLLAQMHRRNLDLKASALNPLDANEINGININVLKTLLEVSAEYDQAKGINNSLRKDQKQFDSQRKPELMARRAQLQDESLSLTRQIAELKIKKTQAETEGEKENIQTQIGELEIVQAAVKEQISQINTEIGTLSSVSGDFEKTIPNTNGFDKSKFPGTLDSAFGDTVKSVLESFNKAPQLNASLRLENYLQMQYEILSKQLTLLRDEVGPGERLIFLEMPQSIRASYRKSNHKWAQSWWKIRAYTTCKEITPDYEGVSRSIQKVVEEISEIKQNKTLDLIEKLITDNHLLEPEELKQVKEHLINAKKEFADIEQRGAIVAILGKDLPPALISDKPDYADERKEARKQLEKMFFDIFREVDKGKKRIELLKADKRLINSRLTPSLKNAVDLPNTKDGEKKKIDAEIANFNKKENDRISKLKTELDQLFETIEKQNEMDQAYLTWLNLQIVDPVAHAIENTLNTEIKKYLPAITDSEIKEIAKKLVSSKNPDKIRSCASSPEDYHDTASVIKGLIKGDSSHKVDVVDLDEDLAPGSPLKSILEKQLKNSAGKIQEPKIHNREVRVIDLFPRQSSLNINDIKLRQSARSIKGILTLISGFGANVNYQRSREQYSQFVQQELYSSSFGKGSREFGWTFYPMPGTDRLMSGTRTTYAIMVIPQKATTLLLQSTGCYFQRSERQLLDFENALKFNEEDRWRKKGECSDSKSFIIPIPNAISGENTFWVNEVKYQPVAKNKKVVVSISGRDFSSQIGILVDGVPLQPSLGLGQPFIVDDSRTKDVGVAAIGSNEVKGSFERINSSQIIASFEMGKEYNGTPTITLIAPGKGLVLNSIDKLKIITKEGACPDNQSSTDICYGLIKAPFMFGKNDSPGKNDIKIEFIKIFKKVKENNDQLMVIINGDNLKSVQSVDINGTEYKSYLQQTKTLIRLEFTNLGEKKLYFSLVDGDKTNPFGPIDNPAPTVVEPEQLPSFAKYTVDNAKLLINDVIFQDFRKKPNSTEEYVVVKLVGIGFNEEKMRVDKGSYEYISPTEAIFEIEKSKAPVVITLIDDENKLKTKKAILGLPPKEPKKAKKGSKS
jgi:hypothetical protein